jgi:hypothetical protein
MLLHRQSYKALHLKAFSFICIGLLIFSNASAHVIVGELERMSKAETVMLYLKLGYEHIIPQGFDHILFVLSLCLINPNLKAVLFQATAFTIAHTITLGLAMYHVITPSPAIVEPVIALSIMYVAIENIYSPRVRPSRIGIVFLFGLIHGMGFANSLAQLGLPQNAYLSSLLMFNIGVELGQVTIILLAYLLMAKWFGHKPYYRRYMVIPLSAVIVLIASFWTVQRLFF